VNPSGDWTLAASIMTFAIPVGLFVIVATILYFLYTRPHAVPGHRELVPAGVAARRAAPAASAAAPAAGTQDATTEGPAAEGSEGTE
jgi:hypothetical protein